MNTMNRWLRAFKTPLLILALGFTGAACLWPSAANAQSLTRTFPDAALRGILEVVTPPEVLLNGAPARLSPGARIKAENNLIVMSGSLVGQRLRVNYVRDSQGMIHEVWILNEAEVLVKRAGQDSLTNIRFASDAASTPAQDPVPPVDPATQPVN
jgi:hypothetical protein